MFSSDCSFSWLLLYQHLALSSCSTQCILESFSGKNTNLCRLRFWLQTMILFVLFPNLYHPFFSVWTETVFEGIEAIIGSGTFGL